MKVLINLLIIVANPCSETDDFSKDNVALNKLFILITYYKISLTHLRFYVNTGVTHEKCHDSLALFFTIKNGIIC